jgi:hypothetical protein
MVTAWFVQNPHTAVSPTTTPTFVGFPYINFVSKCLKHFRDIHMTYLQPLSDEQCIYFTIITYLYPLLIVCLTRNVNKWILTQWYVYNMPNRVHWNNYSMVKPYSIIIYHVPAKAVNANLLRIICLANYITGESLRNGTFTICQIGFIGAIIQWWQLMQWNDMK